MGNPIERIIPVAISRETQGVPRAGFGKGLVLDTHFRFPERTREYSDLTGMTDDGFLTTDLAYKAARAYFSQSPTPTGVVIGRRKMQTVEITVGTATTGSIYTVTIDGTNYSHTATGGQSSTDIANALEVLIDASGGVATAVNIAAVLTIKLLTGASVNVDATVGPITITGSSEGKLATAVITVTTANVGEDYTVTVNGTDYTHTAIGGDTTTTIADALEVLLDALTGIVSADNTGAVLTVTVGVDGLTVTIANTVGPMTMTTTTTSEAWDTAHAAVLAYNNAWYLSIATTRVIANQILLSAATEAVRKIFLAAESTTAAIDTVPASDTTSFMALAKAAGYDRTCAFYHSKADGSATDEWPDASAMGYVATVNPDVESFSLDLKSLPGVTVDVLTDTQFANVVGDQQLNSGGKNGNVYIEMGGAGRIQNGKVSGNEWLDIMVGVDWLHARLTENVFAALATGKKNPYTNAGIAIIENEVRKMMQIGIGTGFLAKDITAWGDLGYRVSAPRVSEISAVDKAARVLKNVKFNATVAGAIHAVQITGAVSA